MSLRRFVLVLVALSICTVLLIILTLNLFSNRDNNKDPATAKPKLDTKSPAYAYITNRELIVLRGNQVITRVPRIFVPSDPYQNGVAWTHSGDYIAVLSDLFLRETEPKPELEQLIFANTRTGRVSRIPCPHCSSIAAFGKNEVIVLASNDKTTTTALRFNLDTPGPGNPLEGRELDSWEWNYFLASTRRHVLVNTNTTDPSLSGDLVLAKIDGSPNRALGSFSTGYIIAAASEKTVYDGAEVFATAYHANPGACVSSPFIHLIKAGAAEGEDSFNTDVLNVQQADASDGLKINDIWWGLDGRLHATIASWTCNEKQRTEDKKMVLSKPSSLWRLDGQKWVHEDPSQATMVRQLDQKTRVVLVIPDCIGPVKGQEVARQCNLGKLYRDAGGQRTLVADKVISISAPPLNTAPTTPSIPWPTPSSVVHG